MKSDYCFSPYRINCVDFPPVRFRGRGRWPYSRDGHSKCPTGGWGGWWWWWGGAFLPNRHTCRLFRPPMSTTQGDAWKLGILPRGSVGDFLIESPRSIATVAAVSRRPSRGRCGCQPSPIRADVRSAKSSAQSAFDRAAMPGN